MATLLLIFYSYLLYPVVTPLTVERVFTDLLVEEEELFVRAFVQGFKDIPHDILKIYDIPARARFVFEDERKQLHDKTKEIFFLRAIKDNQLVGLITFQTYGSDQIVYIRALAVDPAHMRTGVGTFLVSQCKEFIPSAKELVLATRSCNYGAIAFYKALGFFEYDEVPYGWDPTLFIGLKYQIY